MVTWYLLTLILHWTFFCSIVPLHNGLYSTMSPFTQCIFQVPKLTGDILLGVSLWWTSTPSRGSSNTPRHRMLHAKETGISSSWLDLWPLCTITLLLNILNVILNLQISITKSPVGSVKSTVWRLSTVWSLQVEFCRLWGLQSEVCRLRSAAWSLQSEVCSLRFAGRVLQQVRTEFCSL